MIRFDTLSGLYTWAAVALVFLIGSSLTGKRARRTLVWGLGIAPIFFLYLNLFASQTDDSSLWIYSTRGGVCALATGAEPILFVSDLSGDDEAQFSYLISPQLRQFVGSRELTVAQFSADYTTSLSTLRTIDSFSVKTALISDRARLIISDQFMQGRPKRESYPLQFSLQLDSADFASSLDSRVTDSPKRTLLCGRSLGIYAGQRLYALILSATPEQSELTGALKALERAKLDETQLVIIAPLLTPEISAALENFAPQGEWRLVTQRANPHFAEPSFLSARTEYLSETGALQIIERQSMPQ